MRLLVTMQTAKQQSWKLSINAKFNNVHFKFNARNRNPTWKLLKFSLFLKLQESIFQVNTKFRTSIPKKQTSLKSKCLQFFRKFKTSSAKKQPIAAQKSPILENPESKIPSSALNRSTIKEPIFSGSLFIGTLALLTKSISEKNQKGAIIHGLSILLFMALYFKKYVIIKDRTLMVFLTIALLVSAVWFPYGTKDYYVSQIFWKIWNYVASSGSLYMLLQVIFSRFCQSLGVSVNGPSNWIS